MVNARACLHTYGQKGRSEPPPIILRCESADARRPPVVSSNSKSSHSASSGLALLVHGASCPHDFRANMSALCTASSQRVRVSDYAASAFGQEDRRG